jgi:shikimate kinase
MRIYLTGFMGSGKSTIGRIVAQKLGFPFIDLDKEIELKMSDSIAEIFDRHGEFYFRHQERELLQRIVSDPMVMATGGGCFIHNRDWMLKNGVVVFLDVPFEDLVRRLGADPSRPLWKNALNLYTERYEHYKQANFIVDASGTPEEVVEQIINLPLQELKKTPEN